MKILIANDIHYIAPELYSDHDLFFDFALNDGKMMVDIEELTDAFILQVLEEKPQALVLNGDITFNGETLSHEVLAKKLQVLKEAGITVLVLPGNHDINNPFAREFREGQVYYASTISAQQFKEIYKDFGYDYNISYDEETLSYFFPLSPSLYLLMLDVNQYEKNMALSSDPSGKLKDSTVLWIKDCFEKAKAEDAQVVIFVHQNVLDQSVVHNSDYTIKNSELLKNLMVEYGYTLSFSGHIHMQRITQRSYNDVLLTDVANSSLVTYVQGYGQLVYTPKQSFVYDFIPLDVDRYLPSFGTDRYEGEMDDFFKYSYAFYYLLAYQRSMNNLAAYEQLTELEKTQMAEAQALMNTYYFAGMPMEIRPEVRLMPGYFLWKEHTEIPQRDNFLNMFVEPTTDPWRVVIEIP